MSLKKIGITAWLADVFTSSHKAISENLTVEQYEAFVKEAEVNADAIAAAELRNTELEGQVQSLQQKLDESVLALSNEQTTHQQTSAKLVESENKLAESVVTNQKLRDAVNPLGSEDLVNSESQDSTLTKTDIAVRASFKENRPQA